MGLFDFFKKNKKDEQDEYRNDRQNDNEIQEQDSQQPESDGTGSCRTFAASTR